MRSRPYATATSSATARAVQPRRWRSSRCSCSSHGERRDHRVEDDTADPARLPLVLEGREPLSTRTEPVPGIVRSHIRLPGPGRRAVRAARAVSLPHRRYRLPRRLHRCCGRISLAVRHPRLALLRSRVPDTHRAHGNYGRHTHPAPTSRPRRDVEIAAAQISGGPDRAPHRRKSSLSGRFSSGSFSSAEGAPPRRRSFSHWP